jgi:hypothetical protein
LIEGLGFFFCKTEQGQWDAVTPLTFSSGTSGETADVKQQKQQALSANAKETRQDLFNNFATAKLLLLRKHMKIAELLKLRKRKQEALATMAERNEGLTLMERLITGMAKRIMELEAEEAGSSGKQDSFRQFAEEWGTEQNVIARLNRVAINRGFVGFPPPKADSGQEQQVEQTNRKSKNRAIDNSSGGKKSLKRTETLLSAIGYESLEEVAEDLRGVLPLTRYVQEILTRVQSSILNNFLGRSIAWQRRKFFHEIEANTTMSEAWERVSDAWVSRPEVEDLGDYWRQETGGIGNFRSSRKAAPKPAKPPINFR